MKNLSISLFFALLALFGKAQYVPQGMNYQAVARSLSGEVLASQSIALKINLYNGPQDSSATYYSEIHNITTNQLGLFNLIIGAGKAQTGEFNKVPWSTEEIWMEVSIKDKNQPAFTTISSSKLLAVPYAFHAGTASELVPKKGTGASGERVAESSDLIYWSTKGNPAHSPTDKLGSTDSTDLVLITNARERLKISADGQVRMGKLSDSISRTTRMVVADENGDLSTRSILSLDSIPVSSLDKVIQNGNTTDGSIIFNNDDNFIQTKPSNYNESLKQGKFTMAVKEFPGVNGQNNRSNVVGSFWGYNTSPGGGQAIQGEASYRFAGETFFDVGGQKMMEFHLPEIHTNAGLGVRPFSMYIDRNTGIGSANFQMHQFNFKKVNDGNIDWMRMRNDAGCVRLELLPEAGGSSYFEMNGRTDNGNGGYYHNKAYIVNNGADLGFVNETGDFKFNKGINTEGNLTAKGIFANNYDPNSYVANSIQGRSTNNRLLVIGDEVYSEKFYITPQNIVSSMGFISLGEFVVGGVIKPYGGNDFNIKFNTNGNNAKLNFISDAGGFIAGQVSVDGMYAKSIQTDRPSYAAKAGKLKIGSVVSATITGVTGKYLQIEIDGVNYKIALVD
jgi:hypothetical protein